MQVFFKMIIDDGEKYYAGEDPGVAICDYVYMRGLNGIDDNTFWENQRKHYREHMQISFGRTFQNIQIGIACQKATPIWIF